MEKRIGICLLDLETSITTQFKIQRWSFDFYLPDYNILIEVNGDNIHANPEIFKETDILVPSKLTAKEIWERDKKKIDFAKKYFEALGEHYKDQNFKISFKERINKTRLAALINNA